MTNSVFTELEFWLLVLFSIVVPFGIYGVLMMKRAISRRTILLLGFALVVVAGLDFYFLQVLAAAARRSASLADDTLFLSEVSIALYLLPAMFGGIGINVISNVLQAHLVVAQRRFAREHPARPRDGTARRDGSD